MKFHGNNVSLSPEIKRKDARMSIDNYKLTSMEEPTDEVLSQLMKEAAEEASQSNSSSYCYCRS